MKRTTRARRGGSLFVPTDFSHLHTGLKGRARNNLAAIALVKRLQNESKYPTPEDREVLAKFTGWGALKYVFEEKPEWADIHSELQEHLTDQEYRDAKASILNSHYTAHEVIEAIMLGLKHLGYDGIGRVLEPAMGIGGFIGHMPLAWRQKVDVYGVEIDPIAAAISGQLYPEIRLYNRGFQETDFPDASFSLAVGNWPFGAFQVADPKLDRLKLMIHNYYWAKTALLTRPGGLIVGITSTGTLGTERLLRELNKTVQFIGAIRLPSNAFKLNAGTEVTTDILILKRMDEGEGPFANPWLDIAPSGMRSKVYPDRELLLNRYFLDHPHMMLGVPGEDKLQPGRLAVHPDGRDLKSAIVAAFETLPADTYEPGPEREFMIVPEEHQDLLPYNYIDIDGQLYQRQEHSLVPVTRNVRRLRGLMLVAQAVRRLREEEMRTRDDEQADLYRAWLNTAYDDFIAEFGRLNSTINKRVFKDAPDTYLLQAIEMPDDEGGWRKGDIFRRRTVNLDTRPTKFQHAQDAVLDCINYEVVFNLEHVAQDLDRPEWESRSVEERLELAAKELFHEGLAYFNPSPAVLMTPDDLMSGWELSDIYLSGNVRRKLQQVIQVATNPDLRSQLPEWIADTLTTNIEALKRVHPKEILPDAPPDIRAFVASQLGYENCSTDGTIFVRLGAPWLPTTVIEEFAETILQTGPNQIEVNFAKLLAAWSVKEKSRRSKWLDSDFVKTTYGVPGKDALDLLECLLNQRDPIIWVWSEKEQRNVKDPEATEVARAKASRLESEFKNWIWSDPDRAYRLTVLYNEMMNSETVREFNGDHLILPGSNPGIIMAPHQKRAIWRSLQQPALLVSHAVGLGKTYVYCAAAMRARQLGLANKPVIVCLKSTLHATAAMFRNLYPEAKLLVPAKKDFERENRRKLLAVLATHDFDCLLVTWEQMFALPMGSAFQKQFYQEQIDIVEAYLKEHKADNDDKRDLVTKMLETFKLNLYARLYRVINSERKDFVINFEETGIDLILFDESHLAKNLFTPTRRYGIAGLNTSQSSQRAMDCYMKIKWLTANSGRVLMGTGTDLTNSIAELFVLMRYMIPHRLEELNIEHFDAWSANFAEATTQVEITPSQTYKLKTRFSRFANLPELISLYLEFADLQEPTEEILKDRPLLTQKVVSARPSEQHCAYMDDLYERSLAVSDGKVDKTVDNMLKITGDGRKASLSMSLVNPNAEMDLECKLHKMIHLAWRVWQLTAPLRLTQCIFVDFSTPRSDDRFSVYRYVKDTLMALGVPESEIAFIQDCKTDRDRQLLFDRVNSGEVRFILGGTSNLGTGTNIQEKLFFSHDLDAPWRPDGLIQRLGRSYRRGNVCKRIFAVRYITEGKENLFGIDSFIWQVLETKSFFIRQLKQAAFLGLREIEDVDELIFTCSQIKALASGNEDILEKINVDTEVGKLRRLKNAWQQEQFTMQVRASELERELQHLPGRLDALTRDIWTVQQAQAQAGGKLTGERFVMTVGDRVHTKPKDAGLALLMERTRYNLDVQYSGAQSERKVGEFAGLDIMISRRNAQNVFTTQLELLGYDTYPVNFSDDPVATVRALQHQVNSKLAETHAAVTERIDLVTRQRENLATNLGRSFDQEERLEFVIERQRELAIAIAKSQQEDKEARISADDAEPSEQPQDEATASVDAQGEAELETSQEPQKPASEAELIANLSKDKLALYRGPEADLIAYLKARPDIEWWQEVEDAFVQQILATPGFEPTPELDIAILNFGNRLNAAFVSNVLHQCDQVRSRTVEERSELLEITGN